jgi:hypothetical protein
MLTDIKQSYIDDLDKKIDKVGNPKAYRLDEGDQLDNDIADIFRRMKYIGQPVTTTMFTISNDLAGMFRAALDNYKGRRREAEKLTMPLSEGAL